MKTKYFLVSVVVAFCFAPTAIATDTPENLVKALDKALKAKDLSAAEKLVRWGSAPVEAYRLFRMSLAECFDPPHCEIKSESMSDEEKAPQPDYFFPVVPEGQLVVTSEYDSEGFKLPFAKVDNSYTIVIGEISESARAELARELDVKRQAEQLDSDLLNSGEALPANGGDPFAAYQAYAQAVGEKDVNYLATNGSQTDRFFFGTLYKSNPTKQEIALELARLENLKAPIFEGGKTSGDRAILLVKGQNGLGWESAGAVVMSHDGSAWSVEDQLMASLPPAK